MAPNQAIQVLRSVMNAPAVKLLLSSQDISVAEQAIQALEKATEKDTTSDVGKANA